MTQASARCPEPLAQVVSVQGEVAVRAREGEPWQPAPLATLLCPDDLLRTGPVSRAAVIFLATETVMRVDQNTLVQIRRAPEPSRSLLDMLNGAAHFFSRTRRALEIRTPFVNAAVEGTEFQVAVAPDRAHVTVFEGSIRAANAQGSAVAAPGQSVTAVQGAAPRTVALVRPADAVQWTLYFQPVLPPAGDPAVPAPVRRAAALLAAGQVEPARAALAQSEGGAALALRSTIATARNERAEALALAQQATARAPELAAGWIALSYAEQARFALEPARAAALEATRRQPRDAQAWARLAELELALGERGRAAATAARAAALPPGTAHADMVLGYAALATLDIDAAKAAFERAIAQDSQEPLARLGLGLAKVRAGDLAGGRRDMDVAVALDPNRSLLRSYLGKAYVEQGSDAVSAETAEEVFGSRRYDQAAAQFAQAKALDPADPTPWFYDALLKQSRNDPVGALADIERSIALNDNRAVYRSRLALDSDRAARGAGLARIFRDLGFEQLGVDEGADSLAADPASHSAHRFLSDSYIGRPRHEIARTSELLQSQLMQPLGSSPVPPQAWLIDLNQLTPGGPFEVGLNEFTRLFERDRIQLFLSGGIGNHDTFVEEAVVAAQAGRVALSGGQYLYSTDGIRANNDIRHDAFNVFGQGALRDDLNIQVELRRRVTEHGDLRLNFNPDNFSAFDRREVAQDTARVGAHYAPARGHDVLLSALVSKRTDDFTSAPPNGLQISSDRRDLGYDLQGQYILRTGLFNLTAGGGTYYIDTDQDNVLDISRIAPPGLCFFAPCVTTTPTNEETTQHNGYVYGNVPLPYGVVVTGGLAYDYVNRGGLDVSQVSPKGGLQWTAFADPDGAVLRGVRLRGAYMQGVRRTLLVEQTLEPTQVAGFNQFFDDVNGTEWERYGVGLDVALARGLHLGVEASQRNLEVPQVIAGPVAAVTREDHRERLGRAWLYWAAHRQWALSIEPYIEEVRRDGSAMNTLPLEVETTAVPVFIRHFRDGGLFAELGGTFLHQRITPHPSDPFPRTTDDAFLLDAAIGYRLPNRLGVASFAIRNLLDDDFLIQDPNIQGTDPSNPLYLPARTFLFRLALTL
ncbi:MAG: FecR domain-containing protein [Rhodospirillales bacterium]